jgi:hypothetical protein
MSDSEPLVSSNPSPELLQIAWHDSNAAELLAFGNEGPFVRILGVSFTPEEWAALLRMARLQISAEKKRGFQEEK